MGEPSVAQPSFGSGVSPDTTPFSAPPPFPHTAPLAQWPPSGFPAVPGLQGWGVAPPPVGYQYFPPPPMNFQAYSSGSLPSPGFPIPPPMFPTPPFPFPGQPGAFLPPFHGMPLFAGSMPLPPPPTPPTPLSTPIPGPSPPQFTGPTTLLGDKMFTVGQTLAPDTHEVPDTGTGEHKKPDKSTWGASAAEVFGGDQARKEKFLKLMGAGKAKSTIASLPATTSASFPSTPSPLFADYTPQVKSEAQSAAAAAAIARINAALASRAATSSITSPASILPSDTAVTSASDQRRSRSLGNERRNSSRSRSNERKSKKHASRSRSQSAGRSRSRSRKSDRRSRRSRSSGKRERRSRSAGRRHR